MKTARRLIGVLLVLCMLFGVMLVSASAATSEDSGYCGNEGIGTNLTWTLDNEGTLTISGSGAMRDYSYNNVPWASYINAIKTVVIETGVTTVGDNAFLSCHNLTSVTIGNDVTSIGDRAFVGCENLTGVTIPASVTSIGDGVFAGCNSLEEIVVGGGNQNYTAVNGVLFNAAKTELICFPAGKNDATYDIPAGVTSVAGYAFYNCAGLTGVTIPSSVTVIGDHGFYGCSGLTAVTIPDKVAVIGAYAFSGCSGLTSVSLGSGLTSIGGYAFSGCSGLTNVTIPANVTTLGNGAFYFCEGLTAVTIPANVAFIGDGVFAGCKLSAIAVDAGNQNYTAENGVLFDADKTELICFPAGKSETAYEIPSSVTTIGNSAFYGCTGLTDVTVLSGVTAIEGYAFYSCSGLTDVTIPDSVTAIGNSAFSGCTGLTNVTIPDSVVIVGNSAFYNCYDLTSVTVGDSVTVIGDSAFDGCFSLANVTLGNSVTTIGGNAFKFCDGLTSVTVPSDVTAIGNNAFYGCDGLVTIYFEGSAPTVAEAASYDCSFPENSILYYIPTLTDWTDSPAYDAAADTWNGYAVATWREDSVARIDGVYYDTLAEAVEAADEGDTIDLLKDTSETIAVSKALTINRNGLTASGLTAADGYELTTTDEAYTIEEAEEPEIERFEIPRTSMNMGGNLALMFAFEKSNITDTDLSDYTAEVTIAYKDDRGTVTKEVVAADWTTVKISGVEHWCVTIGGLAAKEMDDDVTVTVYKGDVAVSYPKTDSLRLYGEKVLASSSSALMRATALDMLNYGAEAQKYFDYNTDNLANRNVTTASTTTVTLDKTQEIVSDANGHFLAASVVFKSDIEIQFAINAASAGVIGRITFTDHKGNQVTKTVSEYMTGTVKGKSARIYSFTGMVVADIDQVLTVEFLDEAGNVAICVNDSLDAYLGRVFANTSSKMYGLAEAFGKFSTSAYAYLHRND